MAIRKLNLNSAWLMLSIAIGLGAVGTFLAKRYVGLQIEQAQAKMQQQTKSIGVVVANHDIAAGDKITSNDVAVRPIPADYVSSDAVLPEKFDAADNHVLGVSVRKGEAILWANLRDFKQQQTFSAELAPGKRAVTFPVDEVNSISGLLSPGDKIDLIASIKKGERNLAFPLLQNVLVLATGSESKDEPGNSSQNSNELKLNSDQRHFTTVTLEASPDDVKKIILAQTAGKLTAVLRNPKDELTVAKNMMDVNNLFTETVIKQAHGLGIQIIVGGQKK